MREANLVGNDHKDPTMEKDLLDGRICPDDGNQLGSNINMDAYVHGTSSQTEF